MTTERIAAGRYRLELTESDVRCLQFLTRFFLVLDKTVFTGRFMRRVERIHATLEETK
jgi:hypothetical protein